MISAAVSDEALLALKLAFLVLLYLFVWMIVRSATRDLRAAPQESIILSGADAAQFRAAVTPVTTRMLLVLSSPVLDPGTRVPVAVATRVGRGAENGIRLDGDDFASNRHALVEPRADGLWVSDAGSTNGTFVNGARVTDWRLLHPGDVIRVGQTDLQVEP